MSITITTNNIAYITHTDTSPCGIGFRPMEFGFVSLSIANATSADPEKKK